MFIVGMFIVLMLLMFLFNRDGNFIVNPTMIMKFFADYCVTTLLIVTFGMIIASFMMLKKYFRYKTDGLRAIRSLQDVMFYVSIVVLIVPFFMMF